MNDIPYGLKIYYAVAEYVDAEVMVVGETIGYPLKSKISLCKV